MMAHFRIRLPPPGRRKRPEGREIAGMQPIAGVGPQPIAPPAAGSRAPKMPADWLPDDTERSYYRRTGKTLPRFDKRQY